MQLVGGVGNYVFRFPRMIDLDKGDLYVVPKGTKHRPVYGSAVIYVLIEPDGILNPCNKGGSFKRRMTKDRLIVAIVCVLL